MTYDTMLNDNFSPPKDEAPSTLAVEQDFLSKTVIVTSEGDRSFKHYQHFIDFISDDAKVTFLLQKCLQGPHPDSNIKKFTKFRPHSIETLIKAIRAFYIDNKQFVFIQAPTGSGKSVYSIVMSRLAIMARGKHSVICTSQKLLQEQYKQDFNLPVVKARTNFTCEFCEPRTEVCAKIKTTNKALKEQYKNSCQYNRAIEWALRSTALLNYHYFLFSSNYAGMFRDRELLILDECHSFDDVLTSFMQIELGEKEFRKIDKYPIHVKGLDDYYDDLKAISKITKEEINDIFAKFPSVQDYLISGLPSEIVLKEYRLTEEGKAYDEATELYSLLDRVTKVIICIESGKEEKEQSIYSKWVVEPTNPYIKKGITYCESVMFTPVFIAKYAKSKAFAHANKTLLMSATIGEYESFRKLLGIKKDEAIYLEVPSSFPIESRPVIYVDDVGSLNKFNLDSKLPGIKECIAEIIDRHKNERGLIHTATYNISSFVEKSFKDKRFIFPKSGGLFSGLDSFKNSSNGILVSPSITQGLDMKDDLARWQIIVKVPFPYLGSERIKTRVDYMPEWYQYATALVIEQAYGRIVRHSGDYGVTYVLDMGIKRLEGSLGTYFTEAIRLGKGD